MSKSQVWLEVNTQVATWAKENKISEAKSDALMQLLSELLAPKASASQNPPRVNKDGETEYFCRFHQCYYTSDKMVMSNGKSKGYCKAAIAKWNKLNAQIKKLSAQSSELLLQGKVEDASKLANEMQGLKAILNEPSTYNKEEDWANFNK